jgi:hypothetical protein
MKIFNRGIRLGGEDRKVGTPIVTVLLENAAGQVMMASGTTVPSDTDAGYAVGCTFIDTDATQGAQLFINEGSATSADFNRVGSNVAANYAATATADGLTTGLIPAGTRFVTVTSSAATNAVTLPAAAAGTIGQVIHLKVGSNGYELLTPATSGNTVNGVDCDGTNQLDVAADTLLRVTQVSATGWVAETIAATSIAVTAPDND